VEHEHKHIGEVAAAFEMNRGAFDAIAGPVGGFDLEQVDAVVLGHRQAFFRNPI
jgi:hypothetical protein